MKRVISLLIVCSLLLSITSATVTAATITNAQVEGAINWAMARKDANDTSFSGWCLKFVAQAWWANDVSNAGYATATLAGNAMITNTDQNPPRGATVFWNWTDPSDGVNYGHVGISLGNGQVIHADYNGIKITGLYIDSSRTYRGWGVWGNHTMESTSASTPVGNLDSASGGQGTVAIGGWAFDRDSLGSQLRIHVYIGGQAGDPNAEGYDVGIADSYRPDVDAAYPGVGAYHGFNLTTTTNKRGSQPVYVYAINVSGTPGDNKLIGSLSANISEIPPPGIPTLRIQNGNIINSNEAIIFCWDKTDNTVCYDLKIYDWNSPANLITQVIGISADNTSWSINLPRGNYTAWLISRNTIAATGGNWLPFQVAAVSINNNGAITNPYSRTGASIVRIDVTGIINPTTENKKVMVKGIEAKYTFYNGIYKFVALADGSVATNDITVVDGAPTKLIYADISQNGTTEATDVNLLKGAVAGNRAAANYFEFLASDVNGDGFVNATDYNTLKGFIAGNLTVLPVYSK